MHLIVAFAGAPAATVAAPALPNLARLLALLRASPFIGDDPASFSPPHERAWAEAVGLAGADGALPMAAIAAAADGVEVGDAAVGLMTPVHWRVGSDHVVLADPALLQFDATASLAAFDAVRDLFESEGYAMHWGAPLRWYVVHEELDGLRCASIDRVIGRDINPWLPPQPRARRIRRLQSELQMRLHDHPLNAEREARGAMAVNSIWLSGCGRRQPLAGTDRIRLELGLREAALAGDAAAWGAAWRALDAGAIAELAAAAIGGAPVTLTLCGERGAQSFGGPAGGWWRRKAARWSRVDPRPILEAL